jgi:hypothetical protein
MLKTPESFWALVDKTESCWLWRGHTHRSGYGQLGYHRKAWKAHRLAFTLAGGHLIDGLELDHLCRNRGCVRPDHLELVSHGENVRRAFVLKTHCRNGHPYEGNLIVDKAAGARRCRTCRNGQSQRRKWAARTRHGILRGEANPRAKLSANQVRAIREAEGSNLGIAARFGVSDTMIGLIRARKAWKSLT